MKVVVRMVTTTLLPLSYVVICNSKRKVFCIKKQKKRHGAVLLGAAPRVLLAWCIGQKQENGIAVFIKIIVITKYTVNNSSVPPKTAAVEIDFSDICDHG